jgi:outer membrane protein assembly factor BamB
MNLSRRRLLKLSCLGAVTATGVTSVSAESGPEGDYPNAQMYGHSMTNRCYLPEESTPTGELYTEWEFETGDWVISSPVIDGGRLYVGSFDGSVYCLDPESGEKVWEFASGHRIGTVPCVSVDRVFFGNQDGKLFSLSKDTGEKVWGFQTEGWIRSSPKLYEGTVYTANYEKGTEYTTQGKVLGVNSTDGTLLWETELDDYFYSTPAIQDDVLYIGGLYNGNLYAINSENGKVIWEYSGDGQIGASPVVAGDRVYIGDYSGITCLDTSGEKVWGADTNFVAATPSVSDDVVYFASMDGTVFAHDRYDGKRIWMKETDSLIYSGGLVLSKNHLLVHSTSGTLQALNPETGDRQWKYCLDENIRPVCELSDGSIYLGTHDTSGYTGTVQALSETKNTATSPPGSTCNRTENGYFGRDRELTDKFKKDSRDTNVTHRKPTENKTRRFYQSNIVDRAQQLLSTIFDTMG